MRPAPAVMRSPYPEPEYGYAEPRVAPPRPTGSDITELRRIATDLSIPMMPWQEVAAEYLEARRPDGRLLYPEIALLVARQNGKTTLVKPLIVERLLQGRRIMHIAQNRSLPRQMFAMIADYMSIHHSGLFYRRRGKIIWPRFGSGSEEILLTNGGVYRIAAAGRGSARGSSNDDVIIDELREQINDEVIAAAAPTLMMSPDPQMIYLSNAGDESSIVLNAVRERAGADPGLAYLEWSAAPNLGPGEREGWLQSNPAIGHIPHAIEALERNYQSALLAGTMGTFETEHLCRWVINLREPLVALAHWAACRAPEAMKRARRVTLGVAVDPSGHRASAAIAWRTPGGVAVDLVMDRTGDPLDIGSLGSEITEIARVHHVGRTGYDPMTDGELVKYVRDPKRVVGQDFAVASSTFVNLIESDRLRWRESEGTGSITEDLTWTSRKPNETRGSFEAVRANDQHPITAALAVIRAVWLASGPSRGTPRLY